VDLLRCHTSKNEEPTRDYSLAPGTEEEPGDHSEANHGGRDRDAEQGRIAHS
jgi:hypothetical protein